MKKIDRRIIIVVTFIFILGLSWGLMKYLISLKKAPPMRLAIEARRYVKADTVNYKTIFSPVSAPGRLSSVAKVVLVAEASGKIIQGNIPLKVASGFNKGDKLFEIYPDEAELALKARKSQYLNILANIIPDIRLDFPEKEQEFTEFLSSINLDKPLPPFPKIKNEKMRIFLTTRSVLSEYYNIRKDELKLKRHTIRAPFDGTYTQVYLEAGAYTNTGGKVAEIINTNDLELEVPLKRFDAQWVKIGDHVTVKSSGRQMEWTGKVIRKSQFVDENTQSQTIFVKLNNHRSKNAFLSGEYLMAYFSGRPIDNVMEIPRNCVFNTNEVFIIVNGRLEKRSINIIKLNEKTLIFNGLDKDEIIVIQPLINVLEGSKVEIQGVAPPDGQKQSRNTVKKKDKQGKPVKK